MENQNPGSDSSTQSIISGIPGNEIPSQDSVAQAPPNDSLEDLIHLFDDVARSLASPTSIVERLVREVRLALNAHSVSYFRRSDDGDYLIVEAADSRDADDTLELSQLAHPLTPDCIPVYRRFWDLITASQGPALLDFSNPAHRAMLLPSSAPWHDRFGIRWALCCPMLVGERAIGFLGVRTDASECFTESEQRALQSLAQKLTLVVTVDALNQQVAEMALLRDQSLAIERHLAELSRRDRLMTAVVRFSETMARPGTIDQNLPEALHHLPDSEGISRAIVGRNETLHDGERIHRFLYEAVVPGTPLQMHIPGANPLRFADFQEIAARLEIGEILNIATVNEVANTKAGSAIQVATQTKANLLIPVNDRGKWWGTIGFDNCVEARVWTESEVQVLRAAAACVSSALSRGAAEEEACAAAVQLVEERQHAIERRTEELCRVNDALQSIIDALPSVTKLDEFLPAVLRIVAQSFGANQCALFEHQTDIVNLRYWYMDSRVYSPDEVLNFDPVRYDTIIELAGGFKVPPEYLGTPVTDRVRAVLIDHYAGTLRPDFDSFALRIDAGLELNVPLVVDNKAIGAICIYRPRHCPYSPTEVSLAEALAKQLAFAMQTATLAVQVRDAAIVGEREVAAYQRADQLDKANRVLRRAVARFAETPKIEAFLGFVLSESAELIGADGGCMTVYDFESDRVRGVAMSFGGQPVDFPGRTEYTLADTPILRRVISDGPVEIDILAEPQLFWPAVRETLTSKGMKWGIAFPLALEGKVFGHMNLTFRNHPTIDSDQRSIVTALTTQGALAVLLSQLAQAAQRSALLEERSRMAREIHDTVAQGLVAILMHSRAAASGDDPAHHLAVVQRLAEENLAEARRSVRALRPTDSGPDGLQGRLRRMSKKLSEANKKSVTFLSRGQCATLPDLVEDELYRITQEATVNAVKHSRAAEVNLELISEGAGLMLTVIDSGAGFDTDRVPDGRFGVVGMIERAERIGAALTIVSETGRGTTIVVRWQPGNSSREGL